MGHLENLEQFRTMGIIPAMAYLKKGNTKAVENKLQILDSMINMMIKQWKEFY